MNRTQIFIIFLLITTIIYSQENKPRFRSKAIEKIEQIEMARLIQVLDLDEETSVKFFARRKEYREKVQSLMLNRKNLIEEVEELLKKENDVNANSFKQKFNELIDLDEKIVNEKNEFYKSLFNILTPKQVLKLITFDEKFRREIRETIFNKLRNNKK
jgi:Spy/CpxP family protein refolding chaperone